jgi:hypothetical protein
MFAAAVLDLVGLDSEACRKRILAYKRGYDTENTLGTEWWQRVPLFLKNRQLMMYFIVWSWRNDGDPEAKARLEWGQRMCEQAMSDAPSIDFDFSTL